MSNDSGLSGRMDGKVALVSGGASGIGRGVCTRLAEEGAKVVLTDIQEDLGQQTATEINEAGGTAHFLIHDVTRESEWEVVVGRACL